MYCHFTDSGNATKSDAGTQPADSGGATMEYQGRYCYIRISYKLTTLVLLKLIALKFSDFEKKAFSYNLI